MTEGKYLLQGTIMALGLFMAIFIIQFLLKIEQGVAKSNAYENVAASTTTSPVYSKEAAQGKTLFQSNCASCHAILKDLTGPGLVGISERVEKQQLYKWIKNPQAVLASGDKYFNELYLRYNKTPMNTFPNLTNEEIDAILKYIDETGRSTSLPTASSL